MQQIFKPGLIVLAVVAILLVQTAPVAQAVESRPLNLVTSPLPINLSTPPGSTISTDLRIKQAGGQTERLKVSLMKFAAFGDEGKPRLLDREVGDTYFDWVKFDKTQFDAPSNVWQTVKMTIKVPKEAAFGYYYAAVFSRAGDDVRQSDNTSAINGGTAVLVLLDAKIAGAKRTLELNAFSSEHRLYEFLPANFNITFKNSGNVHVIPTGNIFLTSSGGKDVGTLRINGERGNILPGSNRRYQSEWIIGFPHYEPTIENGKTKINDKGEAVRHLVWSNNTETTQDPITSTSTATTTSLTDTSTTPRIRFGRYTATLFAVYDDGSRDVPLEAKLKFWVIPWRFMLVVVVIIAIICFGLFSAARTAYRQAQPQKRRKRR